MKVEYKTEEIDEEWEDELVGQKRCQDCRHFDWWLCRCFHNSNTRPIGGSPKCILRDKQFYSRKWWKFWRAK